jgi:hypothetical protein
MRKCLNILQVRSNSISVCLVLLMECYQSTFLAAGEVTEESVYNCTGAPRPRDVQAMVAAMLNMELRLALSSMHCAICADVPAD